MYGVVEGGTDAITREDLPDNVLLIGVKVKALWAGAGQESDGASYGWSVADPGLYLRVKDLRERAAINTLADDIVLRIEEARLSKKGLGLLVLAEEAGLAGLLHKPGDVPLVSDGVGHDIVTIEGAELDRFVELDLCAGEIVVFKQTGPCQIGIFRCLDLASCGCTGSVFYRFMGELRRILGDWSLAERGEGEATDSDERRASGDCGGPKLGDNSHRLQIRRSGRLTGAGDALNPRTLAAWGTAHTIPDLGGVHVEFGQGAAKSVSVHTKFFGCFALVAFVLREHFEDVAFFELAKGLRIGDAGTVHLRDQAVHFALQGYSSLAVPSWNHTLIVPLRVRFDPDGRVVLELCDAVQDLLLKIVRYNEGYSMSPGKEIGR